MEPLGKSWQKEEEMALLAVVHFKENVMIAAKPLLAELQKEALSVPTASFGSSCCRKSRQHVER